MGAGNEGLGVRGCRLLSGSCPAAIRPQLSTVSRSSVVDSQKLSTVKRANAGGCPGALPDNCHNSAGQQLRSQQLSDHCDNHRDAFATWLGGLAVRVSNRYHTGFRFLIFRFRVLGSGYRVWGIGFRVSSVGFWVSGFSFRSSGVSG